MWVIVFLLVSLLSVFTYAHESPQAQAHDKEWIFWPDYTLPGSAANYPGPRPPLPMEHLPVIAKSVAALRLLGHDATEDFSRLLTGEQLPQGPFSIEMLALDHVNRPIGVLAAFTAGEGIPEAVLGFYGDGFFFGEADADANKLSITAGSSGSEDAGDGRQSLQGFKGYWHHLVGVFDGDEFRLYHNGEQVGRTSAVLSRLTRDQRSRFEIAAYLESEPYMQLANAVQYLAVHNRVLSERDIRDRFAQRVAMIEDGILFTDLFHFTAGPYLNAVQQDSIQVLWEADRPAAARIAWGTSLPHSEQVELKANGDRRRSYEISGLQADTPYFYEITLLDDRGQKIRSGNLTFRSAPEPGQPLSFVVIGDTEARPFVNDQVAKQVWGERPHMLVLVGDLTDGGQRNHRFQWTHEYFLGMNQLTSRVPVIAAPGNGESDLYWYNYYHALPGEESYYSYRIGDAEFFMLDSNMGHRDREDPGFRARQRDWLKQSLASSTAKWKFAGHHHPTYTSDANDYGDTMREASELGDVRVRDDFVDLYEEYQVDAVFFGHVHSYERTLPIRDGKAVTNGGVVYVQTGGGGGNHERAAPSRYWFTRKIYSGYHYTLVNLFVDSLRIEVIDSEGRLRDSFSLRKQADGRSLMVN